MYKNPESTKGNGSKLAAKLAIFIIGLFLLLAALAAVFH